MSMSVDGMKENENYIKKLMKNIDEATQGMNATFEETVLRHQDQFIKCYRLKITELVKLLDELKNTIEDKFINNTLATQLETVLKERDYFKYECLKLNSQHQSLLDDHKNLTSQASNASQQITIYKHLLENEKLKSNQVESNVKELKKNLAEIAMKSLPEPKSSLQNRIPEVEKEVARLKRELREKNEIIRALRERTLELDRNAAMDHSQKVEKKQLYELWRICVEGWKRELVSKGKKEEKMIFPERMPNANKKDLLRMLFTHGEFLKFLERLLFDDGFRVEFHSTEEEYIQKNRAKLMNYMSRRKMTPSQRGMRI